jgi:O-antigen/teichoic acid export membrane protein
MADLSRTSSLKRRLLSGSAWALGGRVALAFTGLANNVLLARLLEPEDLGVYFIAFSLVSLGAVAGALGLNQTVIRFVSESMALKRYGRARSAVVSALILGVLGASGVGLLYLLFGGALGMALFDSPSLLAVTGLVAGWMVAMSLQNLMAETLRGFHDIRSASVFSGPLAGASLLASLGVLYWSGGRASLGAVLLLGMCSGLISVLFAGWVLRGRVASLTSKGVGDQVRLAELLVVTWPILVSSVTLFVLTQADVWILGAFRSQEEVALYGAAARLVFLVAMPLLVVNAVVPPLISEMYASQGRESLQRMLRSTATLAGVPAFLLLLGFVIFSGPLLGIFYGEYYRAASLILVLLSFGRLVNVWAGSCGLVLMLTGHQNTMMGITLSTGALTILGCLWAVRGYGAEGVAAVTTVMLVVQNLLMLVLTKKKVGVWTHATLSPGLIREAFSR